MKASRPDKIMFGLHSLSPDHPPAIASRRYSGADKKEKQRRKQQHRSGQHQPIPEDLLVGGGDGYGALALHGLNPFAGE
jgi:hypothetical protein